MVLHINGFALKRWVLPLLALVFVTGVFWPGLGGYWLFDDYRVVYQNPQVHMQQLDWDSVRRALGGFAHGEYGRPLATLSFALNHLAGGLDPWNFKLTNVLIHAFNAVLVWLLLIRLLRLPQARLDERLAPGVALAVALLWAIHPLQVSSVLYVVQRMETLATTFVFLSLLLYLAGRQRQLQGLRGGWPLLAAAGVTAAIGMLSKETAALAGLYALCLEVCLLRCQARDQRDRRVLLAAHAALVLVVVLGMIYLCLKYANPEVYAIRWYDAGERVLTQFRALPLYLGQMLLPTPDRMYFYYDHVVASSSLFAPMSTFYGALLLLTLLVSAVWLRRRLPLYSLGVSWFFAAHLLTSSPINLELVYEHRNYFALLGIVLAVASLLCAIWRNMEQRMLVVLAVVFIVGFGGLTVLRSATWGSGFLLAIEFQQQNPRSERASNDLAEAYMLISGMDPESPFYELASREFMRGAVLPYASPLPEAGLLLMAAASGQPGDLVAWQSLQRKMRGNPPGVQENAAIDSLLRQYMDGLPIDAQQLDRSIEILFSRRPPAANAWASYGDFLLHAGLGEDRAVECYGHAFIASGYDMEYLQRIVRALEVRGKAELVRRLYLRVNFPDKSS